MENEEKGMSSSSDVRTVGVEIVCPTELVGAADVSMCVIGRISEVKGSVTIEEAEKP